MGVGRRGHNGFSIPELLVVLLVVSLLAYVAVPHIEIVRFRMDGAARGAVGALVAAQRLAVKRQHDVVIMFDSAGARLLVHQDRDNDGVVDTGEPVRPVSFDEEVRFGFGQAPAMGGDAGVITFTERQDGWRALRFLRNGSASEDGAFYLTSTRAPGSSDYAGDSRLIRVDRPTGRVTWFRYSPPSWTEGF